MNRPSARATVAVWCLLLTACLAVDYGIYRLLVWWL